MDDNEISEPTQVLRGCTTVILFAIPYVEVVIILKLVIKWLSAHV